MLPHLFITYAHAPFLPDLYCPRRFPYNTSVPQAVPASPHLIYVSPPCTRFSDAVLSEPSLVVSPSIIVI